MHEAVTSVAAVSEENSASAEVVSAATEEMTAQMQETLGLSQHLSDLAHELRAALDVFTYNDADAVPATDHVGDLIVEHAARSQESLVERSANRAA